MTVVLLYYVMIGMPASSSLSSSFRHKVRQSYMSITVCPIITTFYTNLHTRRVYNHTGYDFTIYFRLAVIEVKKKRSNIPPPTVSGRISRAKFKPGSRNFYRFIGDNRLHKSAGYDGRLQNAIKSWTKVRKTGVAGIAFCLAPQTGGLLVVFLSAN